MKTVQAMLNFELCSVSLGYFIVDCGKFKLCQRNYIYLDGIEIFKSASKNLSN